MQQLSSFTPIEDRILVRTDEGGEYETDLHIPDMADDPASGMTGVVISVAENAMAENGASLTEISEGDQVLFNENVGRDFPAEDDNYRLVRQANLLAVLGE